MDAALMASSSSSSIVAQRSLLLQSTQSHRFSSWNLAFNSSLKNLPIERGSRRGLVVTGAKKKKNKVDSHSFFPSPEEATGPFPEGVLLKKKIVKEDGRVLPEFADAEEERLYEFLTLQLESDLNLERMRHYEVVYLIHQDRVDEVENVNTKVQVFLDVFLNKIFLPPPEYEERLEKKGRIWRLNNWGLRQLAYKIRKATHANYILMNFELDAKFINDLKSMLDKDERIIRHLVMKRDEAITEDCPPPPEFHTLRAEQGAVDEDDDFDDEDDQCDDEMELEMADQADLEDGSNNIIVIHTDNEDERDEGVGSLAKNYKTKKAAR